MKESSKGKDSSILEELVSLESAAKSSKIGIFNDNPKAIADSIHTIVSNPSNATIESIYNKYKGKPVKALIDYVKDGSSLRVILLDGSFISINFNFTGILCPRLNATGAATESQSDAAEEGKPDEDPFSQQARYFTEVRLLHREVDIVMEYLDANKNVSFVYGTALHPKGNVAAELMKNGLAKISERTIGFTSKEAQVQYRYAELAAKAGRLMMWGLPSEVPAASHSFSGTVVEVHSGDSVSVLPDAPAAGPAPAEIRLALAHTRAPRLAPKGDEPFAAESKEFVRSRLIGKKVTVTVEYERHMAAGGSAAAEENGPVPVLRLFVTLRFAHSKSSPAGLNIALLVVSAGLAAAVRASGRRAEDYDRLLIAEAEARCAGRGLHGAKQPEAAARLTDLSQDSKRARSFFNLLRRDRPLRGVVEFVYSGSRVKVSLPSEGCVMQCSLSQVRCPLLPRGASSQLPTRAAEPFALEAKQFTRTNLLQRAVEIVPDDMDKNGIMLGKLYVLKEKEGAAKPSGGSGAVSKQLYAALLVEQGLARCDRSLRQEDGYGEDAELLEKEAAAKAASIGLWSVAQPEPQSEEQPALLDARPWAVGDMVAVTLSEIIDGTCCWALAVEQRNALDELKALLESTAPDCSATGYKKGDLVAAQFLDPLLGSSYWARARLEEAAEERWTVLFVDYGVRDRVSLDQLGGLDPSLEEHRTLLAAPPLARRVQLAFLKPPQQEDLFSLAGQFLHSQAWEKVVWLNVLATDRFSGTSYVAMYQQVDDPSGSAAPSREAQSINEKISRGGYGLISGRAVRVVEGDRSFARKNRGRAAIRKTLSNKQAEELLSRLEENEALAKREHLLAWRQGDPPNDSDDDADK